MSNNVTRLESSYPIIVTGPESSCLTIVTDPECYTPIKILPTCDTIWSHSLQGGGGMHGELSRA